MTPEALSKIDKLIEEANRFEKEVRKKYDNGKQKDAVNMVRQNEVTRSANLKDTLSYGDNRRGIVHKLSTIPLLEPKKVKPHFEELMKLDRARKNELMNYKSTPYDENPKKWDKMYKRALPNENHESVPTVDNTKIPIKHDGGYYFLDGLINRKNKAHLQTAGTQINGGTQGLFVRSNAKGVKPGYGSDYSDRAYYSRGDLPATVTAEVAAQNFVENPLYNGRGKPDTGEQDSITHARYLLNNPTTTLHSQGETSSFYNREFPFSLNKKLTEKEREDMIPSIRQKMNI